MGTSEKIISFEYKVKCRNCGKVSDVLYECGDLGFPINKIKIIHEFTRMLHHTECVCTPNYVMIHDCIGYKDIL